MKYYVYEYWNPLTKVPFYVGKGQKNRAYSHLKEAKKGNRVFENPHKHYTIRKILDRGYSPIIKIVLKMIMNNRHLMRKFA